MCRTLALQLTKGQTILKDSDPKALRSKLRRPQTDRQEARASDPLVSRADFGSLGLMATVRGTSLVLFLTTWTI